MMITLGLMQQECGTGNFPHREQFLLNDAIDYQMPNGTEYIGYLVIAPQLKINCHGTITSWHALTNFNTRLSSLEFLQHDITFQLWRPSTEDSRVYHFVGSNVAKFIGNEIRNGLTVLSDEEKVFNLTATPPTAERLQFQPGDVIGWYIHTTLQTVDRPLTIVYRHTTSSENAVDLFSTEITDLDEAATPPPCDVGILCSSQTALIPSVVPYVTVEYGKHTSNHTLSFDTDFYAERLSNTPEAGTARSSLCVNNSSPLAGCDLVTPDTPNTVILSTTLDDRTTPITNYPERVSPQFNFITATVTAIVILITATVITVLLCLPIIYRSRKRRSSNQQNNYATAIELTENDAYQATDEREDGIILNENDVYESAATHINNNNIKHGVHAMTIIPLADNDAYDVIATEQRDAAIVTRCNDAYEPAATPRGLGDEQNLYELV